MEIHNIPLLEMLAQMHSLDTPCCNDILNLAIQDPQQFCNKFREVENWVSGSTPDVIDDKARKALDEVSFRVYEAAVRTNPVHDLIVGQLRLSAADVEQVSDYASIADVRPDPDSGLMLTSQDALFMKLLDRILKDLPTDPKDTLKENLSALVAIHLEYPELMEQFFQLAEECSWLEKLQNIQRRLGGETSTGAPDPLSEAILQQIQDRDKAIAADNQSTSPPGSKFPLSTILYGEIQITAIQRQEIQLFKEFLEPISAIEKELKPSGSENILDRKKGEPIAREVLNRNLLPDIRTQPILNRIERRIKAARHYIELRRFVKVNGLAHAWPELASLFIQDPPRFVRFESSMLNSETIAMESEGNSEHARLLQRYRGDDKLLQFLHLQPSFSGLNIQKAQAQLGTGLYPTPSEMASLKTETSPGDLPISQPVTQESTTAKVETGMPEPLTNLYLTITEQTIESPKEDEILCDIRISVAGGPEISDSVRVRKQDIVSIKNNAYNLMQLRYERGERQSPVSEPGSNRMAPSNTSKRKLISSYIKDLGLQLCGLFFTDRITNEIVNALRLNPKVRFILDIKPPELLSLPWESLYIGDLKLPVALVSKHSLVRYVPAPSRILSQTWGTRIRILAVFASPKKMPSLNLDDEAKVLEEVFANNRQVELLTVRHATIDQFSSDLRRFRPHIIHFGGHGGLSKDFNQGALIFEQGEEEHLVLASQFSEWCRGQDVSLVVLNACDTGTVIANDAVSSVAGSLMEAGIPASVAATRPIEDIQAIFFVRELYRALVDGYPLESAMAEARKRVNSENWDWSAFALFASTLELERFKLTVETR
jgi:hypothetical protein